MLAETGIPFINIFPVKELIRNEYPDPEKLKNLIKVLTIGQVKQDKTHMCQMYIHVCNFQSFATPPLERDRHHTLKSKLYYDEDNNYFIVPDRVFCLLPVI